MPRLRWTRRWIFWPRGTSRVALASCLGTMADTVQCKTLPQTAQMLRLGGKEHTTLVSQPAAALHSPALAPCSLHCLSPEQYEQHFVQDLLHH